jgi:hypothetical protein
MKKLFFTIFLCSAITISSQEKNPNVELPDFVIFGSDIVSVRKVDKLSTDFISTVSSEFLKPSYKPDQLNVVDISNPVESDLSLLDTANYRKGFIELKAGRYQLPAGEISYAFPFERGLLHGSVKGLNQVKYVDNSDRQYLEGSLDFVYTLPTNLTAFPGTKFSLSGNHSNNYFKFFGSTDPERKRTLKIGNASLGIQNLYMKSFIFDINGGSHFTYLDNEKFNEALYYGNGFARYKLQDFGLGIKASYQNQNLTTDSLSDYSKNYFFIRPTVSLELFNKIMLEAGFTFSRSGDNYLNALFASIGAELTTNLVLLGEYAPQGEFLTAGRFLRDNFYYDQQYLPQIFVKKKNKLRATIKYEFSTYYQIDGGLEYFSSNNFPYYNNPNRTGFFEINTIDVKSFDFFLNLLYHIGPYGYFYAGFNYLDIKNSDSKKIPYYPNFKADLTYGYYFLPELRGEAKLNYLSERYADLENQVKLSGIWNLGLKITYDIDKYIGVFFELNNILNTKRFIWENYQEKPIDVLAGVNLFFE